MKTYEIAGNIPYKAIEKKYIITDVERRKETPAMSIDFLKTLNRLSKWTIEQNLLENNPTGEVKKPPFNNKGSFFV